MAQSHLFPNPRSSRILTPRLRDQQRYLAAPRLNTVENDAQSPAPLNIASHEPGFHAAPTRGECELAESTRRIRVRDPSAARGIRLVVLCAGLRGELDHAGRSDIH